MVSYQNLRGEHLRQNRQKGRQEIEGDNESEAEVDIRRNGGSQSSSTYRENAVSHFQHAAGSQDYDRRILHRFNINDLKLTRAPRNQAFDGRSVESGSEASSFVDQPKPTREDRFQKSMGSRQAYNTGSHRHESIQSRTAHVRDHNPQFVRQDEHQARSYSSRLREQAPEAGRKVVHEGAYWKPSPGAGCQKAPPPGRSRGFNPSGTVPDYGGLEIWHDDDGKVVERRGRGGNDDGSFDA